MTATDADMIKWQLRCIRENGDRLTDSELKLCASYEEQFIRKNWLSERQMIILREIYERRT
jgi:hypothetical protein